VFESPVAADGNTRGKIDVSRKRTSEKTLDSPTVRKDRKFSGVTHRISETTTRISEVTKGLSEKSESDKRNYQVNNIFN
jgi:hypothetical protein